ncbi:MAG: DUF480 domain-containing protein [Thermoanaerobaculia bacterium]|nr:DUF480 domain-containing protein [Thermoanaerobaculia bacterium]
MPRTRPMTPLECRVVGALMEKEQTTPEVYPLTFNALIAACNQKSNREPVMAVDGPELEAALEGLKQDVLVWRTHGGRADRWQHSLDRRWELDAAGKAIMTLLLLRGPQTPGELRTRSDRLHTFASVEEVESVLQRLAQGFDALVLELPRQPGQRETRWMHLVGTEDPEAMAAAAASAPPPTHEASARRSDLAERLERLETEVAELRAELQALRERLGDS